VKKTIIEVAKELNLSPSTISKIVNGKGRISQETRERVLKYVQEEGYVAMSSARILSSKKSWTIGVIYSDISLIGFEHPFFSRILQSFKDEVEKEGYEIVLIVSKLGNNEMTYVDWCRNKKVDGVLILMGNINNPNIQQLVASSFPVVSADIVMPNLFSVFSDDVMGVKIFIDYALSLGYHHLGIVTGPLTARSFYNRLDHYRTLMKEYQISYKESDIYVADGFGFENGYSIGRRIAENHDRPEIFLVTSDVIAFGVIRGLQNQGIRIPEDISIVGYDDIDFAKHYVPSLTTIRQDTKEIGLQAAHHLMHLIADPSKKKQTIELIPVALIERQSTKKKDMS
jgi:LacI family transcriptional regulator